MTTRRGFFTVLGIGAGALIAARVPVQSDGALTTVRSGYHTVEYNGCKNPRYFVDNTQVSKATYLLVAEQRGWKFQEDLVNRRCDHLLLFNGVGTHTPDGKI